ncbi:type II secretion system F family protein [Ponticoccus sp. SC2-23]|uniref:type II secretion system F family protein n=1 Tax=Alexandriicola marinus TaxID=2081710 RepID=UPI000FDB44E8|nr:type II secretion system F family protein [Alexandriicola marinus]MBM1221550.1 type II secretion system F family protein [Ponticoccus sp. SC6-9]MBM1226591.1 type II secretion system F family protein [Ponticoccus sp. SC6-15]MBM1230542.1 type II secretion system F family protein [Ponticoccus sp. SC6-38]MBM1235065.1 type II secretion system F family protein [Ponticoccus sp. SC6-45]MBM1239563.1 type II secretion system F family protein [Ponticoccus sp. SC6-49]MBM1243345.1 type II secretion sys
MAFMETIETMLVDMLGPFGPLIAVGMLGLILVLVTLPVLLKKQEDPLDKLKASNRTKTTTPEKAQRLRMGGGKDKLEKYSNFLEPQDVEAYTAVRLKLLQAGYRTKNAVRIYHFMQFALGVAFLILGVIYAIVQSATGDPETHMLILYSIGPGAVGYMIPKYWVTRRQAVRQQAIEDGFPDSLDMMLVCVEAGQSLDQSIIRVSKELRSGFPELAEEYELVSNEMKAGKDKTAVLRDMSERCGVPDVASFVTVLIQSQQFGTSIAEALRVYASEMRDKRVMRAEEKANKLPTKMTLATMMLTVPPLLIILIGPSIFEISTVLGGAMP